MAARKTSTTSEYEFVEADSKDVSRCPVCFEIFKTPFLTACCGNHFCLFCVESTKENKDQCPLCQASPISGIVDKNLQRRINELKIYCKYRKEGCQWTGEIGELSKHLDCSMEGDCRYVLVSCPYSCGEQTSRLTLQQHVDKICQLRPYNCTFCDYSSTYKDVTNEHYAICPGNMVTCPNSCGEELIQFCYLKQHLSICPCEVVSCSFANVGCKERLKRQHLQIHIETSVLEHQMMMHDAYIKIKEQNERLKQVRKSTDYWINGYRIMAEEVKRNNWRVYLSSLAVVSSAIPVPLSPAVIKIINFSSIATKTRELQYFSNPFYTHSGGYKMQLSVYPNGTAKNNTHLSLSIHIMKGEKDEQLDWPFAGSVKIIVLNQTKDAEHFQKTCSTTNSSIPEDSLAKPSSDKTRNDSGWGLSTFISLTEINHFSEHKQYVMNNTIYLRVVANVEDGSELFL